MIGMLTAGSGCVSVGVKINMGYGIVQGMGILDDMGLGI